MKKYKYCFFNKLSAFIFLICFLKTILFILISSGNVCIDYDGFAVDKDENLYVGMTSLIRVYSPEGDILRSFSPKTSRGYSFTIEDGETVFVDSGDKQYILDLYGNLLSTVMGNYSKAINSDRFISKSGNEYVVHNRMLRTSISIVDDGCESVVFKMPIKDYIVKLLDTISDFVLFISIVVLVFKFKSIRGRFSY